jgi:predicted dehydrogenase
MADASEGALSTASKYNTLWPPSAQIQYTAWKEELSRTFMFPRNHTSTWRQQTYRQSGGVSLVCGSYAIFRVWTDTLEATGRISSWFVEDLVINRPDAKANHIIQAVGSSSVEKGNDFVARHCGKSSPNVYGAYSQVYDDPNVDIVYIGTPHAFHKKNCLDAIAKGKAVLCEKPLTINARDAREVFDAARERGVYVAEAMWLRHRPLVHDLRNLIYKDKRIGEVFRAFSDFGVEMNIPNLPGTSRYKQPSLGAGSLLDLGIYSITWAILALEEEPGSDPDDLTLTGVQTHWHGVEVTSSALLRYASTGRQGIVTSTTMTNGNPDMLARIQGTHGSIEVHGPFPARPTSFTMFPKFTDTLVDGLGDGVVMRGEGIKFDYPHPGRGFHFEADNTAVDYISGRLESSIVPWSETIRVMEIMDELRSQGGTKYAQDLDA